jgi:hypothetical protein
MYAAIDFFKLDPQNIPANLLSKCQRDFERTEFPLLPEPEPRAESIMPGPEDFRAARGERAQFSICAATVQDERRLSLIEFTRNSAHLLVAQPIRVLHRRERVARQWRVGKDIDQTCNRFGHSPPASLSMKAQRELRHVLATWTLDQLLTNSPSRSRASENLPAVAA